MNAFGSLVFTYLLYPLLVIVLAGIAFFVAKKNALLANKRLIVYTLLAMLILTLPALLGLLDYRFMPWGYLAASGCYLIAGCYNIRLMDWIFGKKYKFRMGLFLTLFLQLAGMLLFVLVFNLCNDLKYGLWACSCMLAFSFVAIFVRTYELYLAIPEPIYKLWQLYDSPGFNMYADLESGTTNVVTLEIYKQDGDLQPLRLKGKAPLDIQFGTWARCMIEDYNKKSPLAPISYHNADEDLQQWIFYKHNWIILPKKYIDCSRTLRENRIGDHSFIVAKRVKEYKIQ